MGKIEMEIKERFERVLSSAGAGITIIDILYLVLCVGICAILSKAFGDGVMNARKEYMEVMVVALDQHGFKNCLIEFSELRGNSSFYLYSAIIARILRIRDSFTMFKILQISQIVSIVLIEPIVLWQIFRDKIVIYISPILLILGMWPYMNLWDTYYCMAWISILGTSIVLLIFLRDWDQKTVFLTVLCWIIMAIGNSLRANSAIGICICLILVIVMKIPRNKRGWLPVLLFCTLLFYFLLTTIIPKGLLSFYHLESKSFLSPWHSLYIGIGFEENPFGIEYLDGCAYDYVLSINPNCEYCSPEYMMILRDRYFELLREYPLYFAGHYFRKAIACFRIVIDMIKNELLVLVVFLISLLFIIVTTVKDLIRKKNIVILVILALCFFAGFIQPMIAIPLYVYIKGALGVATLFEILVICYAIVTYIRMRRDKQHYTERPVRDDYT